jgi:hypothetical protein
MADIGERDNGPCDRVRTRSRPKGPEPSTIRSKSDAPGNLVDPGRRGLSPGPRRSRNRLIRVEVPKSAGVLRDQQTLGETTGLHGHLLLWG